MSLDIREPQVNDGSTGSAERSEPGPPSLRRVSAQRQVSWDLLRSGLVLLVVTYHATCVAPVVHPDLAPRPFSFSHQVGASLLLVVSAYFACATLGRHSSGRYWWGRMARLVPAFLAAVVLAWATLRYLAPTEWHIPSKRDLVGNLLLLGNWKPQEFPFLDGSYWTLPLQLMAFTMAALMWRSRWGRGRGLRVALWVAVLLSLGLWPVRAAGPPEAYRMVIDGLGVHRVHLFIAGVTIWMWANGRLTRPHFLALIITCLLGHVLHTLVLGPGGWSEDWTATIGVFCGIAVICFAARTPDWGWWIPGPLRMIAQWLAGISYGLYLTHQAIGYLFMRHLQDLGVGPLEQSLAMLAAGLLLGWMLTRVVERPAHRALMNFYDYRVRPYWASRRSRRLLPVYESPIRHSAQPRLDWRGRGCRPVDPLAPAARAISMVEDLDRLVER